MIIGSLSGVLADRSHNGEVLIEVGGVGYRVTVSGRTSPQLPSVGQQVRLVVHHQIREDHQQLYGFSTRDERDCFEALIGARGVGPAMGMAFLGVYAPSELNRIVFEGDADALCLIPGVGKKTAARLLIELKDRLDIADLGLSDNVVGAARSNGATGPGDGTPRATVRAALSQLGYGPDEIRGALVDVEDGPEPEMLRTALQRMSTN